MSLNPESNTKLLDILKDAEEVGSSDIEEYVIGMKNIQKKLKNNIDTAEAHYVTRPPPHINRLLERLNEKQTKAIHYWRNKSEQNANTEQNVTSLKWVSS